MNSAYICGIFLFDRRRAAAPDGQPKDVEYKTGDVLWRDPVKHSGENIRTTELHALFVEMKGTKKK